MPAVDATHVVFVGAMGSGKTTIGKRVAAALGRPFVDNDETLERTTGKSAADLSRDDGVHALHRVEAEILLDALRAQAASVIAAAASTITDAEVRRVLGDRAFVVWLRADPSSLIVRIRDSPTRPFGDEDPARVVREQSERRDPLFAEVANATFTTDSTDTDAVVRAVVATLGAGPGASRTPFDPLG